MNWQVPLSDLDFGQEEKDAVMTVLENGWLAMGEVTQKFEQEFAESCGVRHGIAVTNGDVLTTLRFRELVRFHKQQGAAATIAMHRRKVKIDLGVILCNGGSDVVGYIEKPTYDYSVSMGVYVFEPRVIDYIPRGEHLDFPNLVHKLLGAREKVVGFPFEGYWQDLGRPDDYEQANIDFEQMRSEFLPEVEDELASTTVRP